MRVLVTGGAGFIGSHLTRLLLAVDREVVVLDDLSTGRRESVPVGARLVVGDILNPVALRDAAAGCELAYHLAAVSSIPACLADPVRAEAVNVEGTARICEAVPRVVLASSIAVRLGDGPYARSKRAGEEIVSRAGGMFLRLHNVYGPGQPARGGEGAVVAAFVAAALTGEPATIHGDGRQRRDFVHVDDVVTALYILDTPSFLTEIGTGHAISVRTLWQAIRHQARRLGLPDPGEAEFAPAREGDVREAVSLHAYPNARGINDGLREMLRIGIAARRR